MYQHDATASRTVDWWSVCTFVDSYLEKVGEWPMAGTLAWQALPAGDAAKLAALLDAARHHALRVQLSQEALAEASQGISAVEDWHALGNRLIRRIPESYVPRKKAS